MWNQLVPRGMKLMAGLVFGVLLLIVAYGSDWTVQPQPQLTSKNKVSRGVPMPESAFKSESVSKMSESVSKMSEIVSKLSDTVSKLSQSVPKTQSVSAQEVYKSEEVSSSNEMSSSVGVSSSESVCPWNEQRQTDDATYPPRVYNETITLWDLPRNHLPLTETGVSRLLPEFRNPCWYGQNDHLFYCLPYFYQLGVAKSGTSQFHSALFKHSNIVRPKLKEIIFWSRPLQRKNFLSYLSNFDMASQEILESSTESGCHNKIIYDATPNYFTMSGPPDGIPGNMQENTYEPIYTLPHTLYAINPRTKFIVLLRHPANRLFSHYHCMSAENFGPDKFHDLVEYAVKVMTDCHSTRSFRSCAFDNKLLFKASQYNKLLLQLSTYSVYAREWLSVFPRDQMLFIKSEEFYENPTEVLREAYEFLEVGDAPQSIYDELTEELKGFVEQRKPKAFLYRDLMWNKTRSLLDEYFRPFNQDLAALLGDDKWLFL